MEVSEDRSNMEDTRGCRKAAMCEQQALCACGLEIKALQSCLVEIDMAFSRGVCLRVIG